MVQQSKIPRIPQLENCPKFLQNCHTGVKLSALNIQQPAARTKYTCHNILVLSQVIYPKYYKNSNESCTFTVVGQIRPSGQCKKCWQNNYKIRVSVHCSVLTKNCFLKKTDNSSFLKSIFFGLNRLNSSWLQSIVAARVYSQCLQYLGCITLVLSLKKTIVIKSKFKEISSWHGVQAA